MQNVEDRNHQSFRARIVGCDVSVADGEQETEHIGCADADDGIESIEWKRTDRLRDVDGRDRLAEPVAGDLDERIEARERRSRDAEIGEDRPAAVQYERARKRVGAFHSPASSVVCGASSCSGRMKRRRDASKSNSSE